MFWIVAVLIFPKIIFSSKTKTKMTMPRISFIHGRPHEYLN